MAPAEAGMPLVSPAFAILTRLEADDQLADRHRPGLRTKAEPGLRLTSSAETPKAPNVDAYGQGIGQPVLA